MKAKGSRLLNIFLILGLLAFVLIATYRIAFYASYLYFDINEMEFDWHGGEQDVLVNTDGNSWIIESGAVEGFVRINRSHHRLHINVWQNDSIAGRESIINIRSGCVKGLGNKTAQLRVVQRGKRTTFINVSKQAVSFPEQGGTDTLNITIDGGTWDVVASPLWISRSISGNTLVLKASPNKGEARGSQVTIKSGEITSTIEVSQNEGFTKFWESFTTSPAFQKSRIAFPLPYAYWDYMYDDDDGPSVITDSIAKENWNFENFHETSEYQVLKENKGDSFNIIFAGRNCGIHEEYIFELNNGEWYLTRIEDYSD